MDRSVCISLLLCLVVTALANAEDSENAVGQHWALIVAGSNGYFNYRHQADACHAYQIMKKHGIPEARIITMMYDDIANSDENPTPGIIINHPNGTDVYGGVKIDYRGDDVTPENFLNILQGNQEVMKGIGSGRVIKSGPNDHVFVNFVDHGAPGLVAFPNGVLSATKLKRAIMQMYKEKKYKQMVLYVEACESGSMFENLLPTNVNVYATTAANSHESSYACYYSEKYNTYLGDVYSVMWMEDSDAEDLRKESLYKQYEIVKKETNTSHVQEFGDMGIAKEPVADFQGGKKYISPKPVRLPKVPYDAMAAGDVPLAILRHRLRATNDLEKKFKIIDEMKSIIMSHQVIRQTVKKIVKLAGRSDLQMDRILAVHHKISDFACYEPAMEMFHEKCFSLNKHEYALRHLYTLVNLCEEGVSKTTILQSIVTVCDGSHL
ncbi:Legumain [Lamellibrachia satsuma]|nr:Legumain [Lamellibrachia satsuma]